MPRGGGVRRVDPQRLVLVAVGPWTLQVRDLPHQVMSSWLACTRQRGWLETHQQRILLGPLAGEALVVAHALLDPVRHRRPLLVVGEVLGQVLGEELDLARGGLERVALGILVEVLQAGRVLVPVGIGGDHVVALLLELLVA